MIIFVPKRTIHYVSYSEDKVRPATKMAELIDANPHLLLMLQHFNIDFRVNDLTVWQLCIRQGISENLFVSLQTSIMASISEGHNPSHGVTCFW